MDYMVINGWFMLYGEEDVEDMKGKDQIYIPQSKDNRRNIVLRLLRSGL